MEEGNAMTDRDNSLPDAERPEKMVSQSTVLELGFTKSMISTLLPEPTLKRNPHYASAPAMKLWKESDVRAVMETEAFRQALDKSLRRKKSAEKAVATKRENAEAILDELISSLVVVRLDLPELKKRTLAAKQDWYNLHDGESISNPDAETVERWMVNFIRHRLCRYDSGLMGIWGKVGKQELYQRLKVETLKKISITYPELSDECNRQISFLDTRPGVGYNL